MFTYKMKDYKIFKHIKNKLREHAVKYNEIIEKQNISNTKCETIYAIEVEERLELTGVDYEEDEHAGFIYIKRKQEKEKGKIDFRGIFLMIFFILFCVMTWWLQKVQTISLLISVIYLIVFFVLLPIAFVLGIKYTPMAIADIIFLVSFIGNIVVFDFISKNILEMVLNRSGIMGKLLDYVMPLETIVLVVMLLSFCIYYYRKYSSKTLGKVIYCVTILAGYLSIVGTVIWGYANLFTIYHNDLYYKYTEELCKNLTKTVERDEGYYRYAQMKYKDGYLKLEGRYNNDNVAHLPEVLAIEQFGSEDTYINSVYLEPKDNTVLSESPWGTTIITDNIYFSTITYFTVGYGDVYPVDDIIKKWVVQESVLGHLLSGLLISIFIILGQKFVEKPIDTDVI